MNDKLSCEAWEILKLSMRKDSFYKRVSYNSSLIYLTFANQMHRNAVPICMCKSDRIGLKSIRFTSRFQ